MPQGGKKRLLLLGQLAEDVSQLAITAPPSTPASVPDVTVPQTLAGTVNGRIVGYNSFSQFSQASNGQTYRMPQYQQAATLVDVAQRHYAQGDDLMKEARGIMSLGDAQRHRFVKPYPGGSLEGFYIKSKVVKFRLVQGALCTESGWSSFDHLPAAEAADIQYVCMHHFERYPYIYQELRTTLWKNVFDRVVMMVPGHPVYIPASQENWAQFFHHHFTHGNVDNVEIIIGFVCGDSQPVEGKLSLVDPHHTGGVPMRQVAKEQAPKPFGETDVKALGEASTVEYEVEEMTD